MKANRAELVKELEQLFNKKVFAIIFNPLRKEGIVEDDEFYFRDFVKRIIIKNKIDDCIILINGFGGNLRTAIACSEILRRNIDYYECFVPSAVSSSMSYFILQSDKLLIGEKSLITQIDPIFEEGGIDLRAIENLGNKNLEIRRKAKDFLNSAVENLKRVIKTPPNVFEKEVVKASQKSYKSLKKLIDFWMGKDLHESGLDLEEIKTLKIKHKILSENFIEKANELVSECRMELAEENARFVIQTSILDGEKYFGGFFYDKQD